MGIWSFSCLLSLPTTDSPKNNSKLVGSLTGDHLLHSQEDQRGRLEVSLPVQEASGRSLGSESLDPKKLDGSEKRLPIRAGEGGHECEHDICDIRTAGSSQRHR